MAGFSQTGYILLLRKNSWPDRGFGRAPAQPKLAVARPPLLPKAWPRYKYSRL